MPDILDRATQGREIRHYAIAEFEFRDAGSEGFTFDGVASVVDAPYEVHDQWGTFSETVARGAFSKTLRDSKADVALFVNHDYHGIPLATRRAGTLTLTADPNLRVSANLDPARPDVQILRSAVTRGEMSQMSIGFSVPKDKQTWSADYSERTIHEVKLVETSVVWQGANPLTVASMRSFAEMVDGLKAGELDESELRRIIDHLGGLLPKPAEVAPESFQLSPDELAKAWEKALAA